MNKKNTERFKKKSLSQPFTERTKKVVDKKIEESNKDYKKALKLIMKAGVHLGHYEGHPKMRAYISGNRKNRKILNLKLTFKILYYSKILVDNVYKKGGRILFVCTKPGLSEIIKVLVPKNNRIIFINHKWVGGTLTNWDEIIKYVFDIKVNNKLDSLKKSKKKRFEKLFNPFLKFLENKNGKEPNLQKPSLVVLFHGSDQKIPVSEAKKTQTPVISIMDSDGDPQDIF